MTEERIAKLEKVGFAWSLAKWGVDWDERYVSSLERERACQLKSYSHHSPTLFTSSLQAELLAYRQQHGNCNVPLKYEKNTSLGVWVSNQRQQYKKYQKGGKSSLTEERIAKLEKVGFAWSLANRHLSWDDRYVSSLERERDCQLNSYSHHSLTLSTSSLQGELLVYHRQHGNCNVPQRYKQNTALGNWVDSQRKDYKKCGKGGKISMTKERIAKLENVGFAWSLAKQMS